MADTHILVVEDERITALDLRATLESLGYSVPAMVSTAQDAVAKVAELKPDLVLMDIKLEGPGDGVEAAEQIRVDQDVPVIFLSAFTDPATLERAKITEPYGYLVKPYQERELHSAIEVGLYKHRMERRVRRLNEVLKAIRNVNQLIVQERDRDVLLQRVCECLTETRGYDIAWIFRARKDGTLTEASVSGLTDQQREHLADGDAPAARGCLDEARLNNALVIVENPSSVCSGCPVGLIDDRRSCLAAPLRYLGQTFGYLQVMTSLESARDSEEQELFAELAGDLAHALHSLREAQGRQRAEEARVRLEEQLQQSQKMESIGRLAGGVAHDFNNIFTVVSGFAELIVNQLEPEHVSVGDAREILGAAEEATRLTTQLLAFSSRQNISPKVVDLNEVVGHSVPMLERLIGERVDINFVTGARLWAVRADPGQMDQILINLAVNARDAICDGGKMTLETRNVALDQAFADSHLDVAPGDYVMLAVSDDGHGIEPEALSQIFEPFYTTKSGGKGTGLGLSMVYGIIKQQGGFIFAYSEVGSGTTMKIFLPRVRPTAEGLRRPAAEESLGGMETVLVVEDAEPVRRLTVRILERAGYEVLAAVDGRDGIERAKAFEGEIHLLITDVMMPRCNGPEMYDELVKTRPVLPVLYMSGYTDNALSQQGVLEAGTQFLPKPFTSKQLLSKIREALD